MTLGAPLSRVAGAPSRTGYYVGWLACKAWLAEHPDIEPGTNGLENPAARGLMGGRGLVGSGAATFEWRGQQLTTSVMPYRFWLMQRLRDDLAAAETPSQARIRTVFSGTGLEPLLDLRTLRRVERQGHLEVWGPVE